MTNPGANNSSSEKEGEKRLAGNGEGREEHEATKANNLKNSDTESDKINIQNQ